ncbi:hypothetical protein P775_25890 [Puniceibacterium antarcticum]|uniref:Uncharacterized protein n=1 Tax=Puniceibacterium antarcticum TaxID=1206336 RepID=A0A2G8R271_9RHOB|nr:hypothetical protein [Puniceibacterium antarcticum]PIL15613.1 hypothetical protein P775_25890 [Puniceibacterium antarcticum]
MALHKRCPVKRILSVYLPMLVILTFTLGPYIGCGRHARQMLPP